VGCFEKNVYMCVRIGDWLQKVDELSDGENAVVVNLLMKSESDFLCV